MYDIDKVYQMGFSLALNGLLYDEDWNVEENTKNEIVESILAVTLNPKNQINLNVPINMDAPQDAAKRSTLGKAEKSLTSDNPMSKYIMQVQNMAGKQVIGITAVSLKTFFLVSHYYNELMYKAMNAFERNNMSDAVSILNKFTISNPFIPGKKTTIANLNFDPLKEYLRRHPVVIQYDSGNTVNLYDVIDSWNKTANITDAATTLSAILSAATDNAKELILSKINATAEFVDIYNYATQIGIPFDDIASIMLDPIFDKIVDLTKNNIFDSTTYGFSLEKAIDFYLGENILPLLNTKSFIKLIQDIDPSVKTVKNLFALNNTSTIEQWKQAVIQKYQKLTKRVYSEDQYYDYEEEYYEEPYEEYDDEYSNTSNVVDISDNPKMLLAAVKMLDYLKERILVLDKLPNAQASLNKLQIIKNILSATKEMQILGRMAAINQGIPTNSYDKYNYIKNIENYINRKILKANEGGKSFRIFDLKLFLSDPEIRAEYINNYEQLKNSYNILEIITTVPHFNEMFKILYTDNEVINSLSARNALEKELANNIVETTDVKLTRDEFKELSNYVNDVIIYNWLTTLDKTIEVPVGQTYYVNSFGKTETNEVEGFIIQLNSTEGIASFKRLVEDYIIPTLKTDERFKDNVFIKSLIPGVSINKQGKVITFFKLPINMMQIDSSLRTKTIYESILNDFNSLSNQTFNGWNVIDLFYLYNLVVNKDNFGQKSLTRLFEDVIKTNDSLLVNEFYNYVSKLDSGVIDVLHIDLNDLLYRLLSVSTNTKKFNVEDIGDVWIYNGSKPQIRQTINKELITDSNFTFMLPFTEFGTIPHPIQKRITSQKPINYYYSQGLNSDEIITTVVNRLNTLYPNANITIVTNQDLVNEDEFTRNASGYISNGQTYINIDKSKISTPLHELSHMVLAGMKAAYPTEYYALVSSIQTHPLYDKIASNVYYNNKHASDLDEEVFVTIAEQYFQNKLFDWSENVTLENAGKNIFDLLTNLFQIHTGNESIQDIMSLPLEDILQRFTSNLLSGSYNDLLNIEHIALSQRMATLKHQLISQHIIEENCNG